MKVENKSNISVVVPVLNEEESLPQLHKELTQALGSFQAYEIIFIDDGSHDRSDEIIRDMVKDDPHVKLVKFHKNYGKADALAEGFRLSSGDVIITMDADLQDDPAEIPKLVKKISEGWDVVSGWKKNRKDPLSKTIPSKLFNLVTRWITGVKIHDFNCGLKAYKSKVVKSIELYGGLHRYIPAIARQKGFAVTEMVVNHRPRKFGKTKYGGARFFHGFFDLLTVSFLGNYFTRPLHFFGLIGLILTFAGLAINVYLTIGWYRGVWIGNRPILFLGVLLMVVGIQFFSIGLLGEMLVKSGRRMENRVEQYITHPDSDENRSG